MVTSPVSSGGRAGPTHLFPALPSVILSNRGSPFAQEESEVYCYVCQLRETSSAPTKASHFLEALRFAAAILKFEKVDIDRVLSTRICGAAHAMFLKKRKLKQAPHFTVEAVQALELVCLSDERDHCRLIAGSLLFCILACVRWGDSMNIERCWTDSHEDVVLVEAETSRHKTSKSKEAKTRLLPYTATSRGGNSSYEIVNCALGIGQLSSCLLGTSLHARGPVHQ